MFAILDMLPSSALYGLGAVLSVLMVSATIWIGVDTAVGKYLTETNRHLSKIRGSLESISDSLDGISKKLDSGTKYQFTHELFTKIDDLNSTISDLKKG